MENFCSICLEPAGEPGNSVVLNCGHVFHTTPCFLKLVTYAFAVYGKAEVECPNCRQTTSTIGVPNIGALVETLFFQENSKECGIRGDTEEKKH
jgi:hypothetical protein